MPKLPRVTAREIVRALKRAGFIGSSDSIAHFRHPDGRVANIAIGHRAPKRLSYSFGRESSSARATSRVAWATSSTCVSTQELIS